MSGARRDLGESAKKTSGDRRDRREESARLDPRLMRQLHRSLRRWHAGVRRDVPWRQTTDPYRILVAEYMSQQTQLERVRVYYERFLQRFPTIEVLARASLQEVRKAWEGLGYYARARHVHEAARRIVREYGGRIPDDPARLQTLPGRARNTGASSLPARASLRGIPTGPPTIPPLAAAR
jgi:A/G-specific adenine glycosylase